MVSEVNPKPQQWIQFISNLLLWLGALALSFSVLFFLAYNWNDLGRFAKFGLVQIFIAIAIGIYVLSEKKISKQLPKNKKTNTLGQVALFSASILLGVLLAFYGQTYQTGADPWQLFFMWALLIIPWAVIAKSSVLWMFWVALMNLSLMLYYSVFSSTIDALFSSDLSVIWLLAITNMTVLTLWELLKNKLTYLSQAWATRSLALVGAITVTMLMIDSIFNSDISEYSPEKIFWLVSMVLVYLTYYKRSIDLLILTLACFSGLMVITCLVGILLFDETLSPEFRLEFRFLLMMVLVLSLGGLSTKWLKSVHKKSLLKDPITNKTESIHSEGNNNE